MRLILASRSPRRTELLGSLGVEFEVVEPAVDETRLPGEHPAEYVERVAIDKASRFARQDAVVLAADTVVVHRGNVLGKPAHPSEARHMLSRLSGEAHTVMSGVAVAFHEGEQLRISTEVVTTTVRFLELTDGEIAAYVATGEPMDKAGAYALQGLGAIFVESVEGSPSNVVGLPLHAAAQLLRAAGIDLLSG